MRTPPPLFPHQPGYSRTWRGRPPRLVAAERALMRWWLDQASTRLAQIWYDVPITGAAADNGAPPPALRNLDAPSQRLYLSLNSRRADAITEIDNRYTIIEARDQADAQTLGQVEIYWHLAQREWPELTWPRPVIIARDVRLDALDTAHASGITIAIAPADLYDRDTIGMRAYTGG